LLANGDSYEGNWKDDKMHGRGKFSWGTGEEFDGEFKEGTMVPPNPMAVDRCVLM
jgi:1-phosphatidylinositol-4-phosphate 5-kinase